MARVWNVSSTEFARRFGRWSVSAQTAPVMVTNRKTGKALGYFVSVAEYERYLEYRQAGPATKFAWEMSDEMSAELDKPFRRRSLAASET